MMSFVPFQLKMTSYSPLKLKVTSFFHLSNFQQLFQTTLKANTDEERLKLKILKKYFTESKNPTVKFESNGVVSGQWLPQLLFCRWSQVTSCEKITASKSLKPFKKIQTARSHVCRVMAKLNQSRRNDIFRLMSTYLEYVDKAGESAAEFLELYATLASRQRGSFYLFCK